MDRVSSSEEPTAKISSIFIYPIKSCRGISVSQAPISPTGNSSPAHSFPSSIFHGFFLVNFISFRLTHSFLKPYIPVFISGSSLVFIFLPFHSSVCMLNFQVRFIHPDAEIVSWLVQDSNCVSMMFILMGCFFWEIPFDQCLNPSVLLSTTIEYVSWLLVGNCWLIPFRFSSMLVRPWRLDGICIIFFLFLFTLSLCSMSMSEFV